MSTETYWVVFTQRSLLCHWSLARSRRHAVSNFYAGVPKSYAKWRTLYQRGFRCRKVKVTIA